MKTSLFNNPKKIICIAYALGRTGSSAMMGLLQLSDVDLGKDQYLTGQGKFNPKGFFELKNQQEFLIKAYKGFYPNITDPPSIEVVEKIAKKNYNKYYKLLKQTFTGNTVALKGMRMLTIPFLHNLQEKFDIKTIVLNRNETDQINSTIKVWKTSSKSFQRENANQEFLSEYIQKWKRFANEIIENYNFNYYHVNFEDLYNDPVKTSKKLFTYLDITSPEEEKIEQWLEPKLVNRKTIN